MHVVFVSKCERRAIKRTRAILDAYANRIGDFTWTTPVTSEALEEIRLALRRKATRQTSVACYRNAGLRRMRLLWTVGNSSHFGRNGEISIGLRARKTASPAAKWVRIVCKAAGLAGLTHDLGKANVEFQAKIAPNNAAQELRDAIRHDLISLLVLHRMLSGRTWKEAWKDLRVEETTDIIRDGKGRGFLNEKPASLADAVLYAVGTHHRLFKGGERPIAQNHLNVQESGKAALADTRDGKEVTKLAEKVVAKILADKEAGDEAFWLGVSTVARAATILADHKVSSVKRFDTDKKQLFANTGKNDKGRVALNQSLDRHLREVGEEAGRMVMRMALFDGPGLSLESAEKLTAEAREGRFLWQNAAADSLPPGVPALVLNVASTGAGKTRMNARAVAVLAGEEKVRITVVLNLKTLTLQTGNVFKGELGIGSDELAVVVGDKTAFAMDEFARRGNESLAIEYEGEEITRAEFSAPEWLAPFAKRSRAVAPLVMAPVLVSTVDHLVDAGDPRKNAGHALALLRLMHSDLIIDEIDGYEPAALSSVLRLVQAAASFGKNVVISSATLPPVVAIYAWKSYESGNRVFQAMNGADGGFRTVIVDDSVAPLSLSSSSEEEFQSAYAKHLGKISSEATNKPPARKGAIVSFEKSDGELLRAIGETADLMHGRFAWGDGIKISIGLVRVANIRKAVEVAEFLKKEKKAHVCCYHSRHFSIQRFHIEQRLDFLLKRKGEDPNRHICEDKEIAELVRRSNIGQVKIVVVATPVEEIGRDHDFDWAVVEPSSAQSIVQVAGRVNRHRIAPVKVPNVAILRWNFMEVAAKKKHGRACFIRPGCELLDGAGGTHPTHDMCELIDKSKILQRLDASLRFDDRSHKFSEYDNRAVEQKLRTLAGPIIESNAARLCQEIYKEAVLREQDTPEITWYLDEINNWREITRTVTGEEARVYNGRWAPIPDLQGLFTLSLENLEELRKDLGLSRADAFKVRVLPPSNETHVYKMTNFGCL